MISRPAGFTIIELMVVLALLAVLAAISAPSVRDTIRNARMTSMANDLLSDLAVARAEAVKRGVPTAICASSNGTSCTGNWNQGWIIFTDNPEADGVTYGTVNTSAPLDTVLKKVSAIEGASDAVPNTIVTANGEMWVGFRPSGMVKAGGGPDTDDIVFNLCDSRTVAEVGESAANNRGRQIKVSLTGRAHILRRTCP